MLSPSPYTLSPLVVSVIETPSLFPGWPNFWGLGQALGHINLWPCCGLFDFAPSVVWALYYSVP